MKKVIINCRYLTQALTGVQRFSLEITKTLVKGSPGIEFLGVAPKGTTPDELETVLKIETFGYFSGQLWEQLELPLFLKKHGNPILLNLANSGPLLYSKNIITLHDIAFSKDENWFSSKFTLFYCYLIPRLLKKSIHVLTVSEFSKSEIQQYGNLTENHVTVVFNGTEHLPTRTSEVKKENFYLTVGSLDPRKNLGMIFQVFTELGLPLKVAGGSSLNFNWDHKVFHANTIEFLGRVNDEELFDLYAKAKGFIYLSLYEGFGIPPVEAICFGTRPIVSKIPVFNEILGDKAIYCSPLNQNEIIATLREFERVGYKNKLTVIEKNDIRNAYSWKLSAKKIEALLLKI